MSALAPPPKIDHPPIGTQWEDGVRMMVGQMERLAAWMYEAAQRVEAITGVVVNLDDQARQKRRDAKRALLMVVSLLERDGTLADTTAAAARTHIENLAGDL